MSNIKYLEITLARQGHSWGDTPNPPYPRVALIWQPRGLMTNEIWKHIPSLPDYEASDLGRVRHAGSGLLKNQYHQSGEGSYRALKIRGKRHLVHRLIAEAFHGPSALLVNHKNGIKFDNRVENLEYATQAKNVQHAYDTGLNEAVRRASSAAMVAAHAAGRVRYSRGSRHYLAKLSEVTASEVKSALACGMRDSSIALIYGVARETIRQIRLGKTWKHI